MAKISDQRQEEIDRAVKAERQRTRAILHGLPMLAIEAPDEQAQRRLTHFVVRVDELISGVVEMPPDLEAKIKEWQATVR